MAEVNQDPSWRDDVGTLARAQLREMSLRDALEKLASEVVSRQFAHFIRGGDEMLLDQIPHFGVCPG